MRAAASVKSLLFFVIFGPGAVVALGLAANGAYVSAAALSLGALVLAYLAASSLQIMRQWERGVLLRLGRFRGLRGPGVFWIIPVIGSLAMVIDRRTITTPFRAEKTLTLDTVPVDVDAVLFWRVTDSERAALEVEQYAVAVEWSSQTALRDVIGRSTLAQLLSDRRSID